MQHNFIRLLFVLLTVGFITITTQQIIKNCPPRPRVVPGVRNKCPSRIPARAPLRVDEYHCQKKANIYCCGPLVSDLSACFTNPQKCRTDSIQSTRYCTARTSTCCCKGRVFGTFQQCNQRFGVQSKARRLYQEEEVSTIPPEEAPCSDSGLATCHNTIDFENNNTVVDECYDSTLFNCTVDISDNVTQCVCTSAEIIDPTSSRALQHDQKQIVNAYRRCFFGQCYNNDIYYVPDATVPFIALRAPNPTVEKEDPGCAADIDGTFSGRPDGFKTCSGVDLYVSEGCIWRKLPCPQSATLTSQCRPDVFEQARCSIQDGRWYEPCVPVITGRTGCSAPLPDGLECDTDETLCYGKDVLTCDDGIWTLAPCAGSTQCRGGACAPTDCLLYENCTVPGENLCGGTPCPFDQECCGGTKCFSPDTSICLAGTVCPVGFLECDGECYIPGSRVCLDGEPDDVLCIPTNGLCNETCFNTTTQQCLSDIVCDVGLEVCGDQCIDPTTETCTIPPAVPSPVPPTTPPEPSPIPEPTVTIPPAVPSPVPPAIPTPIPSPILSPVPPTTPPEPSPVPEPTVTIPPEPTAPTATPTPILSPVPSPTVTIPPEPTGTIPLEPTIPPTCPEGEELCGSVCYSPQQEVCLDGILCPVRYKLCGNICFPNYFVSSLIIRGTPCPIICPPGQKLCNQTCYNPIVQTCDHGVLCPQGFFNCNGTCTPVGTTCVPTCPESTIRCNATCIDPDFYNCINGTGCPFHRSPCGGVCYNPVTQVCIDSSVICTRGLSSCGGRCYDPEYQHCLSGKICPLTYSLCGTDDTGTCFLDSEHDCCGGTTVCNPPLIS
jgi:hypothetical protein